MKQYGHILVHQISTGRRLYTVSGRLTAIENRFVLRAGVCQTENDLRFFWLFLLPYNRQLYGS